ncbi:MAG: hypothetical protein KDI12_14195 [Anaerolineae bacterium]|nr:hypothetical protein [Anaerolineae bacterium]
MTRTDATHKAITAKELITTDEANALIEYGWQFTRYYIDTSRWSHVCEPAKDAQRSHLAGAIWYVERRGRGWERVLNANHPATIEQITIDKLRKS